MLAYLKAINYLLVCFFSFKSFKKKNLKYFNTNKKFVSFSLPLLLKILYFSFLNKLQLVLNKKKREKFYIDHKKNFEKYNFNNQWFSGAAYHWNEIFTKFNLYKKELNILEIGSFEGQSALFFLKRFQKVKLFCVDPWISYDQNEKVNFHDVEKQFDTNTLEFKNKLLKFKMTSANFFNQSSEIKTFDIIYVDGNHFFKNVYEDLNNCFSKLNRQGIIIIDDFLTYNYYKNNLNENPIGSVIVFLNKYKNNIKILKITNQIIIQKCNHKSI